MTNASTTKLPRTARPFWRRAAGVGFIVGLVLLAACQRDARLADAKLRDPLVKDVTVAGLTLDKSAPPENVAYALLQAIKADIAAGSDLAAREKAFEDEFYLAAPAAIHAQHVRAVGPENADFKEGVFRTVQTWAPTLGHYVGSFDFPVEAIKQRLRVVDPGQKLNRAGTAERHVLLEAQDPDGDPNAAVIVKIRLVQEEGRWRVWWVGFERVVRHFARPAPTTRPTTAPATAPTTIGTGG